MTYDLIIKAGHLVTMNASGEVLSDALVCVKDGLIEKVLTPESAEPAPPSGEIIDASSSIVAPGLVNAHGHAPMTLFRGLADDLLLSDWLFNHIFPAEARHMNPENARAGTLLAAAEMLLSGTTACCDGYFFEDEVARAFADSGMRAVAGFGMLDPVDGTDPMKNVEEAAAFALKLKGENPRISPSIFCHSPYTCSEKTLVAAKRETKRQGILFQTHAAETRAEREESISRHGKSPIAYLAGLGLLDPDTLLVHCVWCDDEDIKIIADTGAKVAVCTSSQMKLASGVAPVAKFLAAGVTVGLGTDGAASSNSLDMFLEMNLTAKLHKVTSLDPTALPARQALLMATLGAARAMGLGEVTGSIEPGKRADIIVLDPEAPALNPVYDPVSALVYAASGPCVRHVLVDGKIVVKDGKITTFDLHEALKRVREIARSIKGA
ncbi:MAG: amidohydrolase [Deltaproteobacteria bacterium]|nr:amidohydrolase [Deltaproteobacteria bacterium]